MLLVDQTVSLISEEVLVLMRCSVLPAQDCIGSFFTDLEVSTGLLDLFPVSEMGAVLHRYTETGRVLESEDLSDEGLLATEFFSVPEPSCSYPIRR